MSKLDDMIKQLCPDGVEFVKLGEVGQFYGGLTGKSKSDFTNGNAKFITYMNVYTNSSINTNINDFVRIEKGEKQNKVIYGDILFTGSSETPNECGMTSVLTENTNDDLYLNSFCFGYRFNNIQSVNPNFIKHLFRCHDLRKALARTASGVTRFNVSKKKVAKIEIPFPPIEIQTQIANILDHFTELEAELEAELDCRKRQYEFYRDYLLSFDKNTTERNNIVWKKLSEVCKINRGKRLVKKELMTEGKIPVYQNSLTPLGYYKEANYPADTTFIISAGAAGNIGFSKMDFWAADDCICLVCDKNLNSKYLYYTMTNRQYYFLSRVRKASVPRLSRETINKFEIAIPPIEEQNRIVTILDHFESLTTSLQHGLPAEIAARRQQYEYYRDKLLDFKKKNSIAIC